MNKQSYLKRISAFILAIALSFSPVFSQDLSSLGKLFKVNAANTSVRQTGGNLLDGQPFDFYGHPGRTGIFLWKDSNNHPVFCVEPEKAMTSNTGMVLEWYGMDQDWVTDLDDYQKELLYYALAVAGCGEGKTNISTAEYIMVQSAIWAIVSGEWTTPEDFKANLSVITAHIKSNRDAVTAEVNRLADNFISRINTLAGDTAFIPEFAMKPYSREYVVNPMSDIGNGKYSITFDNLIAEIRDFQYSKPIGWDWYYSNNGKSLTFVLDKNAGGEENAVIVGTPKGGTGLATLRTPESIGFYTPGSSSKQIMVAQVKTKSNWECFVLFNISNTPITPEIGEGNFTFKSYRYEHDETFKSNYKVDLLKSDAETGRFLGDTTFSILESFDKDQLNGTGLNKNQFTSPEQLTEHVQLNTDENGYLSHGDEKTYRYLKTYCSGHPDPVIEYIPLLESESDDPMEQQMLEEANAEIEEKNRQLEEEAWAAWQDDVDACEDEVDYHSVEEGEAEEELRANRNRLFENFINLEYRYTVQEVKARNGYILHDLHTDDIPVDIVSMKSSQAGGEGQVIGSFFKGEAIYLSGISTFIDDLEEMKDRSVFRNGWDGNYESSEVSKINQNNYQKDKVGFTFKLMNHRTEGELHINKRDLEINSTDPNNSYGVTQGDATLEGAVYGLYAAEDIIHPDDKTGKIFSAGELVSVATTDKNGDASFLAITEESLTSKLVSNLYTGQTHNGVDYPDYETINGNAWIGRPLFLGSYYIQEIARSEGYELSQYGINLTESNRQGSGLTIAKSGSASVGSLFHPLNEWDGSWNEFIVKNFETVNGYDIVISGYPANSKFYKVERQNITATNPIVVGERQEQKTDGSGNLVYETATGGEYKYDSNGDHIQKVDGSGELLFDTSNPIKETVIVTNRLNYYPERVATSSDSQYYDDPADTSYVLAETADLLNQMKYKSAGQGAPAVTVTLSGDTNGELIQSILDFVQEDDFWDSYTVSDIYPDDSDAPTEWYAVIHFAYSGISGVNNFFDPHSDRVIIKRNCDYDQDGTIYSGYTYVIYELGNYTKTGSRVILNKVNVESLVEYGIYPPLLKKEYAPVYETYMAGEQLLDSAGNPIPEMETIYEYGIEVIPGIEETLTEIPAVYDPISGTYTIHIDNDVDWDVIRTIVETTYRAVAPDTEKDGMSYADWILQKNNGGINVYSTKTPLDAGSYIKEAVLLYPGQSQVYQDAGTRERPVIVLQRVIKQALKVIKTISLSSYDQINTYSIHKDPFTVLHGGWNNRIPATSLPGFHFKLYLVSDLEDTGLLEINENGEYDYKSFFKKENEVYFNSLAVEWDKPDKDVDGDLTTIHANQKGAVNYYGTSIMLPYGVYVIVEQQPTGLLNKHYKIDDPKEVVLPYVPHIDEFGSIHEDIPSTYYLYDREMTPEELQEKYYIRFNEEIHTIQAHNRDGDFKVYKYGLSKSVKPDTYDNATVESYYKWESNSENSGNKDNVYYETLLDRNGNVVDYGVSLDGVKTMSGVSTAVDRKYSHALVPWSVLDPRYGEVINDNGDIGNRDTGLEADGSFNFIAFVQSAFENTFYKSKLRIEKIDSKTGENIIHEGAYFKIYAAKRDVTGIGVSGVEGSGNIIFDVNGIPMYDESEQIFMKDETGAEVGIFKAYSTIKEVVTANGIEKISVGYIETYQPLGAGVYVLVEVEAPEGYLTSPPVAFEIYSDQVAYYYDGNQNDRRIAEQFQYSIPFTETTEIVSQIIVEDKPTDIAIHKVEDGKDTITFEVRGSKDLLEARGDVLGITYDPNSKEWYGVVTKAYDAWSESIVYGTEDQLKVMENVKLIYDINGVFSGSGIRFDIYVRDAELTLYKGQEVIKTGNGTYLGVSVERENRKIVKITATETGTHQEIQKTGQDSTPAHNNIWDTVTVKNPPEDLLFFDLDNVSKEIDQETGLFYILDERGNRTCMADPLTGMAYVVDDYGTIITYPVDGTGEKIVSQSIRVGVDENGNEIIYSNIETVNDENGLPIYYTNGHITMEDDIWNTNGQKYSIGRLPFGAYIVEESKVPYDQGYIRTKPIGFILKETDQEQNFFLEDDFTKIESAKLDIRTKEEIPDAEMTLYYAIKVVDNSEKGYHLEYLLDSNGNKVVRSSWISGYLYDDRGNQILDIDGNKIPSNKPHWIDHIPVGFYILEETGVPYEYGYVQASPIEVIVEETGKVQSFVMFDDFTQLEIIKNDAYKNEVLSRAGLSMYQAELNTDGTPVIQENGYPKEDQSKKILSWQTEDGRDVAATAHPVYNPDTGELLFDGNGEPLIGYNYNIQRLTTTLQGQYYTTETGAIHFDYLPVGFYVVLEEETPAGFATAEPLLIEVKEIGGTVQVQEHIMKDYPLTVEVLKSYEPNGKVVAGSLQRVYKAAANGSLEMVDAVDENGSTIYETDESGNLVPVRKYNPANLECEWITGNDGVYQEGEEIPEGFTAGDLKPHVIRYISLGNYYLVEEETPYGLLKAEPVAFIINDTKDIYKVEMIDRIPDGYIELLKTNEDRTEVLENASFLVRNKDLNIDVVLLTTDAEGKAVSGYMPIGYINQSGNFEAYTFTIQEKSAPAGYLLDETVHEFQFIYQDEFTPTIRYEFDATNTEHQTIVHKVAEKTERQLAGAKLRLSNSLGEIVEDFISTGQPHVFYGLKPGLYTLTELTAPSGYEIATPIIFEVKESGEICVVKMIDKLKVIPAKPEKPEKPNLNINKQDVSTGQKLPGAWIIVYNPDGSVYAKGKTDANGNFTFKIPPAGKYTFQEMEAPEGYFINESIFTFTVDTNGKVTGDTVIKDVKKPIVVLEKKDITDGKELPNAEIEIKDSENKVVLKDRTDKNGKIYFNPLKPGDYTFKETAAPNGYKINETIFKFTVHPDGSITGDHEIYDEPLKGRITVKYENSPTGNGEYNYGDKMTPGTPKTGDAKYLVVAISLILLMISLITILLLKKKNKKVPPLLLLLFFCVSLFSSKAVYAAEPEKTVTETESYVTKNQEEKKNDFPETIEKNGFQYHLESVQYMMEMVEPEESETIEIDLERVYDSQEEANAAIITLDKIYVDENGIVYNLKDSNVNRIEKPNANQVVTSTVTYPGMDLDSAVPQKGMVSVTNENTGHTYEKEVPYSSHSFSTVRWENDFVFSLTFESYDSLVYSLGDKEIPFNSSVPALAGYETELLNIIGVNPEHYKIGSFAWDGEAYETNGVLYRNATAYGSRQIGDCVAVYSGTVAIPGGTGYQVTCTYEKAVEKEYKITVEGEYSLRKEEAETVVTALQEKEKFNLLEFLLQPTVLAIGIAIVIIFMVLILYVLSKKKKEEKDVRS